MHNAEPQRGTNQRLLCIPAISQPIHAENLQQNIHLAINSTLLFTFQYRERFGRLNVPSRFLFPNSARLFFRYTTKTIDRPRTRVASAAHSDTAKLVLLSRAKDK
jgi:hypothetical protein